MNNKDEPPAKHEPIPQETLLTVYFWQYGKAPVSLKGADIDIVKALKAVDANYDNIGTGALIPVLTTLLRCLVLASLSEKDRLLYFNAKRGLAMYGHNKLAVRIVLNAVTQLYGEATDPPAATT